MHNQGGIIFNRCFAFLQSKLINVEREETDGDWKEGFDVAGLQIPHYLKHKSTMTMHTIQGFQKKMTSRKSYKISSKRKFCGMFFPMVRKGPVGGDGTLRLFVDVGSPPVPSPSKTRSHQVPNPRPAPSRPQSFQRGARFPSKTQIYLLNISTIWNWWRETLPSATLKVQNFQIGSVGKTKIFENKSVDF